MSSDILHFLTETRFNAQRNNNINFDHLQLQYLRYQLLAATQLQFMAVLPWAN